MAAVIRTPYPVDCEGHVSFLTMGAPDPFKGGIAIKDGRAHLPEAPGLGVEVDWAALKEHMRRGAKADGPRQSRPER
jgi:L-alanine-DL-glutamate epimerase-like enolase superfamily enzyme